MPIKKKLTFHNVIILIKLVFNKNKCKYYNNVFLEKGLYICKSNKQYFWVSVYIFWMLYYRIDIAQGIDVNRTSVSKEWYCHYWYFWSNSFKFQPNVCSRCQDLLMMSINLSDIVVLNFQGSDYCCIIRLISRYEAINLLQNTDLTEKVAAL